VAQVHEKDVLKCFMEVSGELCVMMDSLIHQRQSFVTCSDTGRLLFLVRSLDCTQNIPQLLRVNLKCPYSTRRDMMMVTYFLCQNLSVHNMSDAFC